MLWCPLHPPQPPPPSLTQTAPHPPSPSSTSASTDVILFSLEPGPSGALDTSRIPTAHVRAAVNASRAHSGRVLVSLGGAGRGQHFHALVKRCPPPPRRRRPSPMAPSAPALAERLCRRPRSGRCPGGCPHAALSGALRAQARALCFAPASSPHTSWPRDCGRSMSHVHTYRGGGGAEVWKGPHLKWHNSADKIVPNFAITFEE